MDPHSLNYITLGSECVAFVFAVALPSVKHSLYFHRDKGSKELPEQNHSKANLANNIMTGTEPGDSAGVFSTEDGVVLEVDNTMKVSDTDSGSTNSANSSGDLSIKNLKKVRLVKKYFFYYYQIMLNLSR